MLGGCAWPQTGMSGSCEAARELATELGAKLDLNASLKLWDGSLTPLGSNVTGPFQIAIAGPGVIGSLLRRPTLDNFIRHYVTSGIDFSRRHADRSRARSSIAADAR